MLRCNAFPEYQMALITSGCAPFSLSAELEMAKSSAVDLEGTVRSRPGHWVVTVHLLVSPPFQLQRADPPASMCAGEGRRQGRASGAEGENEGGQGRTQVQAAQQAGVPHHRRWRADSAPLAEGAFAAIRTADERPFPTAAQWLAVGETVILLDPSTRSCSRSFNSDGERASAKCQSRKWLTNVD